MSKKPNHRIMSMLEKRGYVQKLEDETPGDFESLEADVMEAASFAATQPLPKLPPVPPPALPPQPAPPPATVPIPPMIKIDRLEKLQGAGEKVSDLSSFWDNTPVPAPEPDRFMDIEELYHSFGMKLIGTDTIYLMEEYIKTLPESLPVELRRSIILKIVAASGFDFDKLLNDGIDRVSRLNDYSGTFAQHTEAAVNKLGEEIAALETQIAELQDAINERKNLHKRQFLAIENEGQRLKEILDFITK